MQPEQHNESSAAEVDEIPVTEEYDDDDDQNQSESSQIDRIDLDAVVEEQEQEQEKAPVAEPAKRVVVVTEPTRKKRKSTELHRYQRTPTLFFSEYRIVPGDILRLNEFEKGGGAKTSKVLAIGTIDAHGHVHIVDQLYDDVYIFSLRYHHEQERAKAHPPAQDPPPTLTHEQQVAWRPYSNWGCTRHLYVFDKEKKHDFIHVKDTRNKPPPAPHQLELAPAPAPRQVEFVPTATPPPRPAAAARPPLKRPAPEPPARAIVRRVPLPPPVQTRREWFLDDGMHNQAQLVNSHSPPPPPPAPKQLPPPAAKQPPHYHLLRAVYDELHSLFNT